MKQKEIERRIRATLADMGYRRYPVRFCPSVGFEQIIEAGYPPVDVNDPWEHQTSGNSVSELAKMMRRAPGVAWRVQIDGHRFHPEAGCVIEDFDLSLKDLEIRS